MGSDRIYQLDAVRGLLALGVVVHHVWGAPVLGTWGVYAFFVLSGWAMEHVYGGRFELRRFVVARVARLAPLWVPVVLISAFVYGVTDPGRILLNLSGAFGFLSPGATSIVTGGWSIGIEVACYAMFALLAAWRLSTRSLAVLAGAGIALRLVTVGFMPANLEAAWVTYTVPASFVGFFLVGMLCGRLYRNRTASRAGDVEPKAVTQVDVAVRHASTILGDLSYGTYLLHPLVAVLVGPWTLLVTPPLALAVYRWYEAPMRRLRRDLRDKDLLDVGVRGRGRGLVAVDDEVRALA